MSDTAKHLPWSREAEESVLGSILREPAVLPEVQLVLTQGVQEFCQDAHRRIYSAMLKLAEVRQEVIDLVTVAELLRSRGEVDDVGYPRLAELWEAAPTAANAIHYAGVVHDHYIRRELMHLGADISRDAQLGAAGDVLAATERAILALSRKCVVSRAARLSELIGRAFDRIDQAQAGNILAGIPTALAPLDELVSLRPGELTLLAARPSIGKTALALEIARHVGVVQGRPVLVISLETGGLDLATRMLCSQARLSMAKAMRPDGLSDADYTRLVEAGGPLRVGRIIVESTPSQTMAQIASTARRYRSSDMIELLVVDYLGLIDSDQDGRRQSIYERVSAHSRRLKVLSMELEVPMLALCQLSREAESREPKLSDLRDSGTLEQDADNVWLMHPSDETQDLVQVEVAKQRNGPRGRPCCAGSPTAPGSKPRRRTCPSPR